MGDITNGRDFMRTRLTTRFHRYLQSLDHLQKESSLSLKNYAAADNMDLISILQEFEHYYAFKFGRPPKLSRKLVAGEVEENGKRTTNRANQKPSSVEAVQGYSQLNARNGLRASHPTSLSKPSLSFQELPSHKLNETQVLSSPLLSSIQHRVLPKVGESRSDSDLTKTKGMLSNISSRRLSHSKWTSTSGKKFIEESSNSERKKDSTEPFDGGLIGRNVRIYRTVWFWEYHGFYARYSSAPKQMRSVNQLLPSK